MTEKLTEFARHCVKERSEAELTVLLAGNLYGLDLKKWELTPEHWRKAVNAALLVKKLGLDSFAISGFADNGTPRLAVDVTQDGSAPR